MLYFKAKMHQIRFWLGLTVRGVAHLVVHGTSGSTSRPATKRFHTFDWRALEVCCRPWTSWCNDATAHATTMMIMMGLRLRPCRGSLQLFPRPPSCIGGVLYWTLRKNEETLGRL